MFFIGMWLAGSGLISLSGWRQLARHFRVGPLNPAVVAPSRWFQSVSIRKQGSVSGASYNGALVVRCGPEGLGLSVMFVFRFQHPPLRIPWSAIGPMTEESVFFGLAKYHRLVVELSHEDADIELNFTSSVLAEAIEEQRVRLLLDSLGEASRANPMPPGRPRPS